MDLIRHARTSTRTPWTTVRGHKSALRTGALAMLASTPHFAIRGSFRVSITQSPMGPRPPCGGWESFKPQLPLLNRVISVSYAHCDGCCFGSSDFCSWKAEVELHLGRSKALRSSRSGSDCSSGLLVTSKRTSSPAALGPCPPPFSCFRVLCY